MSAHLEKTMEDEACATLQQQSWLYSPNDSGYDRELALFPEDIVGWLQHTQPEELAKVLPADPADPAYASALAKFLKAVATQLDLPITSGGGMLTMLRKPFRYGRAKFTMCVAKPAETNNPTLVDWYSKVRLRVMRQVHYSVSRPNRSIDLVLFANGFPVATIELKTDFTQSVIQGQTQYGTSRLPTDPGTNKAEPLLTWGRRALVYFVVTNEVVSMTTKLDGTSTRFLPFNRGNDGGAGNASDPRGSDTEYFWQDVLGRDMWLKILMRYMLVKSETSIDPATAKESTSTSIRFPRFHQLDAVEHIVADVEGLGPGQRYLIEHSAGSGKTDTIVWTAQRLAALHDENNAKVFDSVIVVTDRTVLDSQMRDAMMQLDMRKGQVVSVDTEHGPKSTAFIDALKARTPIIVVTIQTAPFALATLQKASEELRGTYVVIADEAHSSQTGNAASKLREVLGPELDEGEVAVGADDLIAATMLQRAESPNISFLAFTATPKAKTMELFGRRPRPAEPPEAFHRYTMRQAIEEGFILDVLQNYTTYDVAVRLAGEAVAADEVDEKAAKKATRRWVELHPYNISQKVAIIVEHFRENVAPRLNGTAKAMVVCASRKEAVRFHHAMNAYIAERGYSDLAALVAFSGGVVDEETFGTDEPVTESSLNRGTGGRKLDQAFNGPEYQVLIVANKFQVGFDQPLLCAMYVNKPLSGVMAVQTLSRLNRSYRGKTAEDVFVLDFVNSTEVILESFAPYYRGAVLAEESDINLVHRLAAKLDASQLYDEDDIEAAWVAAAADDSNKGMHASLSPIKHAFDERRDGAAATGNEGELAALEEFRSDLSAYVRVYRFMSLIFDYGDPLVEKRAVFYEGLARLLAAPPATTEVDLSGIEMTHYRAENTGTHRLDPGSVEATPLTGMLAVGSAELRDPKNEQWAAILDALNTLFGGLGLSDEDLIAVFDPALRRMRRNSHVVDVAYANTSVDFDNSTDAAEALISALEESSDDSRKVAEEMLSTTDRAGIARLIRALKLRQYLVGEREAG